MKTILITGGGGYLGCGLTRHLLEQGYAVRVVDRFFFGREILERLPDSERLELVRQDTREIREKDVGEVDAVVDMAGISNDPSCDLDPAITADVNLGGCVRTARLAQEIGVPKYLYASSCSVYGSGGDALVDEGSRLEPVSLYARTKIEAEEFLLAQNDEDFCVTVMRNATAYGLSPRMRFDLAINLMTLHAVRNRRIFVLGGGRQWRPIVHLRDIARAFQIAIEAPEFMVGGEIFNVGSNEQNYQARQIAQMVREVLPHTEISLVPDDPDKRSYRVDFTKIATTLGFQPEVTPVAAIEEIAEALERGDVDDTVSTRTVDYYRYLLDAQRLLEEVSIDGRVF